MLTLEQLSPIRTAGFSQSSDIAQYPLHPVYTDAGDHDTMSHKFGIGLDQAEKIIPHALSDENMNFINDKIDRLAKDYVFSPPSAELTHQFAQAQAVKRDMTRVREANTAFSGQDKEPINILHQILRSTESVEAKTVSMILWFRLAEKHAFAIPNDVLERSRFGVV
jgi:hypothetical protein